LTAEDFKAGSLTNVRAIIDFSLDDLVAVLERLQGKSGWFFL